MKLNKRLEIGIKIITTLVNKDKPFRNKDFSKLLYLSENKGIFFIEHITLKLKKAKLLTIKTGKNGGMILNRTKNITIYDIAKALSEVNEDIGSDSCTKFKMELLTLMKNNVIVQKEMIVNQYDVIDAYFNKV